MNQNNMKLLVYQKMLLNYQPLNQLNFQQIQKFEQLKILHSVIHQLRASQFLHLSKNSKLDGAIK